MSEKKIDVKQHSRKKPQRSPGKPGATPHGERHEGVDVLSTKPGAQGVQRLSRREPGELETQVEVAVQPRQIDLETGGVKYERII